MNSANLAIFAQYLIPPEDMLVWQWAAHDVDYSLEPAYDAESSSAYDPEFIPLWKEPAECLTDPTVRYMFLRKCSRAGGTETILNGVRYFVAVDPGQILYVGAQQTTMLTFFKQRLDMGLRVSKTCREKMKHAKVRQNTIELPDCHIFTSYFGASSGPKQMGARMVIGDEYSTAGEGATEAFKKRIANYRSGKFIGISSLDYESKNACEDDPMNQDYVSGDQREWEIIDPATGEWFIPKMGLWNKLDYGIKWDETARTEEGTWILKRVDESAHYLTPGGHKFENMDFKEAVNKGRWTPTNEEMAAPETRSYNIPAHLLPFHSGDLGHLAVSWLKANRKGPVYVKTWVYENDPTHEFKEERPGQVEIETVYERRGPHKEGIVPVHTGNPCILVLIADVQDRWLEYGIYCFTKKASWLIENDTCAVIDELPKRAVNQGRLKGDGDIGFPDLDGNLHKCKLIAVDSGYNTVDVYDFCRRSKAHWALKGDDGKVTKMSRPVIQKDVDTYPDGNKIPGRGLLLNHIHPTIFRDQFTDALKGYDELDADVRATKIDLHFHHDIDDNFALQVTAEAKGEDGAYSKIRKRNEQFDIGYYSFAIRYLLRNDISKMQAVDVVRPTEEKKPAPPKKSAVDQWDDW